MKKRLYAIIIALSLALSILGITASAESLGGDEILLPGSDFSSEIATDNTPDIAIDNLSSGDVDTTSGEDSTADARDIATDNLGGGDVDTTSGEDGGDGEAGFLDGLMEAIREHSGEILSALSFITSVILAIAYRKGLTPLVRDGLSAMLGGVRSIKEAVGEANEKSGEITDALTRRLESAEALIKKLSDGIESASLALSEKEMIAGERADMRVIMSAQIDMLYEIFMTSALPEYRKEAIGERIASMKRVLSERELPCLQTEGGREAIKEENGL